MLYGDGTSHLPGAKTILQRTALSIRKILFYGLFKQLNATLLSITFI